MPSKIMKSVPLII